MPPGPGGGAPSRRQLAGWLLTRGAWLILLELTVLRFAWTFNFDYAHFVMAGVLWAIGWSMIILAALIYLPVPAIAAIGLVIVAGHNLMDPHFRAIAETLPGTQWGWLLQILYFGGPIDIHGSSFFVLYSIIPWVGVMAAGYAFGVVMRWSPERRARACYTLGGLAVFLFRSCVGLAFYGDPRQWQPVPPGQAHLAPALLRFLNTNKYPASLLFLSHDARAGADLDSALGASARTDCAGARRVRTSAVLLLRAPPPADPPDCVIRVPDPLGPDLTVAFC